MAESTTAYQDMEPPSQAKTCCKMCGKIAGGVCGVLVIVVILVQAVLYWWATLHCSAGKLQGYTYPGGGDENLVPPDSLLVEQAPRWWGSSFINIPADKAGLPSGASTGVYFRTWGPLWYTYTYQDVLGQETFVVRDRPLAIGGSHKIMRCDGEGPAWVVSEGGHWLMNGIRSMFGMYTSRIYNIWKGNELVAISEKLGGTGQSHKQIIFRAPDKAEPFASAFLKDRHFHGVFDEWFVQLDANSSLPNFIPNGVSMLMAFATANTKAHVPKPTDFLEVTPIAAAAAAVPEGDAAEKEEATISPVEQSATAAITTEKKGEQAEVVVAAPAEQPAAAAVVPAAAEEVVVVSPAEQPAAAAVVPAAAEEVAATPAEKSEEVAKKRDVTPTEEEHV